MRYIQRTVTVEAMKYNGTPPSASEIIGWLSNLGYAAGWTELGLWVGDPHVIAAGGEYIVVGASGVSVRTAPDFEARYAQA